MKTQGQFNKGFTLIELLTVIALMASLASMLFPVFAQARGKARQAVCLSNVHQIGLAVEMYCEDYDGIYPYALDPIDKYIPGGWSSDPVFEQAIPYLPLLSAALQPYARSNQIFDCPADTGLNESDIITWPLVAAPSAYARYGMSYAYETQLTVDHLTEEQLAQPARTALCYDLTGRWHGEPAVEDWRYLVVFTDNHSKSLGFGQFLDVFDHTL